ncbi:MAG: hypothetical protein Greene041679_592 [Parcubacteria group bacterium Greene0416_79]|nr:MAG: hypothetical protein Greene041679_592 [Parcubacteria group bacterium Greene0416_79]
MLSVCSPFYIPTVLHSKKYRNGIKTHKYILMFLRTSEYTKRRKAKREKITGADRQKSLRPFPCHRPLNQSVKPIFRTGALSTFKTATGAAMCKHPLPGFLKRGNGLHHAAAPRGAVSWVQIHMFAPQADGAVVRVPVPAHLHTTMYAGKIFYCSGKTHSFFLLPSVEGGTGEAVLKKDERYVVLNPRPSFLKNPSAASSESISETGNPFS